MDIARQRANRLYQQKRRGGGSIKTEMETAYLMLAWEAAELSEGQMVEILGADRVSIRLMREGAIAKAMRIAEGLLAKDAEAR